MVKLKGRLLGFGVVAGVSLMAMHAAYAFNGPSQIQIDGGPLGPLQISGGVDGYFYGLSGTGDSFNPGLLGTNKSLGANVANALIEIQKSSGTLQFTIEVGSNGGAVSLGTKPGQTSITTFTTGPLYAGYITIAPPNSPVTVSIGQLGSLEGYESGVEWNNANQLTTDIFAVQNSQSRGVSLAYTQGPVSATVTFGDGFDTGVFNFLQFLGTYTFNATNNLNIYAAGNLGKTGPLAYAYGGSNTTSYGANYVNSNMIGAFYSYTMGNLNIVPEVQYVYAKADQSVGLSKFSSNFGAAVFADYAFGTSPYSIGAWAEYFSSNGPDFWFIAPKATGEGVSVSPTYQYKDIFARADLGLIHISNVPYGARYGSDGRGSNQFTGLLEAGLLF